ncbi:MAG: FGGY-family carbohydrate kinase [Spirochaetales bacterium]|nr:FGGY-family carbohydrate kinase [Spirochaetales bacterium]
MTKTLLSIDCGTQSLRTILFNPEGKIIEKVKIEYAPYTSLRPGWAEQDPEIFWQSLVKGCRILKSKQSKMFASISGVGVTALRDTMINMAEDGTTLRPAITWLDTRKASPVYKPGFIMRPAYSLFGMLGPIRKIMAEGKINWIRQHQPDLWEQTWKYVQVSGFLNYRLTGQAADSIASMVGHIPVDHKKRTWAKKGSLLDHIFPFEADKRPQIVESGDKIGTITKKTERETGITEGTPVIACGADKSCETVGMGVTEPDVGSISFGTTATISFSTKRYFSPLRFMPAYAAAVPGYWVPEIEIFRGYWMLRWFRDELGYEETEEAKRVGMLPEELLNTLLDTDPPGNNGLILHPYWGPGLNVPGAKGAIIGFSGIHKKSSIYRGIIEGLGYALRDGMETLERRGGISCSSAAVSGGASQSDRICQITADILGRTLIRGETYETSALGAAIITSAGVGIHESIPTAVRGMVRYTKEFIPDTKNSQLYDRLYHEVYLQIYKKLRKLHETIRDITGYPEKTPD